MRVAKAWIVAKKELAVLRKTKSVLYSVLAFPLFVAVGLPLVVMAAGGRGPGIPASVLPVLLDSFSFFFIIGTAALPVTIASYSLVGEKVERSLEPLLATPATDSEILLGKGLAAFLPPIVSTYAGSVVFMALMDKFTIAKLGYPYFPNPTIAIILIAIAPLACLLSVESGIVISSLVSDIRSAQQVGGLMILPFAAIYVASEIGLLPLTWLNLLAISGVLLVVDLLLYLVSRATFRRDDILTRWK
ncbi:MAG: ABC transporter permease [Thermoplasmata archaeon]|nr:ABC transporter permease [Thermoplasmata archaeon]